MMRALVGNGGKNARIFQPGPWMVPPSHAEANGVLKRVLVPADALPKTTGVSMAVIASGGLVPDHVHESKMEVFVVVAADEASLLSVRGSDGGEVQLDVGDAVVFYPGVQHGLRNIGPGDVTVMYFGLV